METGGNGRSQRTLHSTPSSDEPAGWTQLLSALTDDELRRYGEIAVDQCNLEYDRWWAQILLCIAAVVAMVWGVWQLVATGVSGRAVVTLVVAVACAYWPYRKVRMRRLWKGHCEAVAQEQARRATKVD